MQRVKRHPTVGSAGSPSAPAPGSSARSTSATTCRSAPTPSWSRTCRPERSPPASPRRSGSRRDARTPTRRCSRTRPSGSEPASGRQSVPKRQNAPAAGCCGQRRGQRLGRGLPRRQLPVVGRPSPPPPPRPTTGATGATTLRTPSAIRAAVSPSGSSPGRGSSRPTSQADSTTCGAVAGRGSSCAKTGPSAMCSEENHGLCALVRAVRRHVDHAAADQARPAPPAPWPPSCAVAQRAGRLARRRATAAASAAARSQPRPGQRGDREALGGSRVRRRAAGVDHRVTDGATVTGRPARLGSIPQGTAIRVRPGTTTTGPSARSEVGEQRAGRAPRPSRRRPARRLPPGPGWCRRTRARAGRG